MSNKRRLNRKKCIVILAIFLIILILIMMLNKKEDYSKLTILIDNKYVDLSKTPIVDEESNIYFSKEDVQKLFDDTIYYNEAEEEIITTGNTHVALLKSGENKIRINNEEKDINGNLKIENGIVYIPITDLSEVYDIELYYYLNDENERQILTSYNPYESSKKVKEELSRISRL